MGAVASRVNKEPFIDDALTNILREYTYLEVMKLLGLTIKEYLDLTTLERSIYINYLEPIAEEKRKAMEEVENSTNDIPGANDDFQSKY